jgi:hypothetical protein
MGREIVSISRGCSRKRLQRKARKRRGAALRTWSVKRGFGRRAAKMRPEFEETEYRGQGTTGSPAAPTSAGRRTSDQNRTNEKGSGDPLEGGGGNDDNGVYE